MIDYDMPLYRPPAEANSIIIQATLGCSFNKCTFCTMYESKTYRQRPLDEVFAEIDTMSRFYSDATKLFLADGDALAISTTDLIKILEYCYKSFPKLRRVSLYASDFNIQKKSLDELKTLKEKGLGLIYYGVESGSFEVLKKIQKPISNKKMIDALNKVANANIKTSVTVILGLGGKKYTKEHISQSANIINQVEVTYLSTLQLMMEEHTKQKFIKNFGEDFQELDDKEMLCEQKSFIEQLNPKNKVIFRSNHVSNALPLKGTFPKDKQRLIDEVGFVIENFDRFNYYGSGRL